MKTPPTAPRRFKQPLWEGGPLDGNRLYVYPEQGLGDVIHFARYVALVEAEARSVTFEVPASLLRLFEESGLAKNLITTGEAPPEFDCHVPLLDLPQLLNTALETIPGRDPYLTVPGKREESWAERMQTNENFRLGIVWAGDPIHKNDRNRSIAASEFLPLTDIAGLSVYSLQVDSEGEAAEIFGDNVTDLAPSLTDFAETAAAMRNLDLIVSADTSVVHLAGALGRPVWTLLPFMPDWRWLLERDDSPWYPTMRLFRQHRRGDWQNVIERVRAALTKQLEQARS